jgi:hypothetical protein
LAKSITRVRASGPKGIDATGANGSVTRLTDSTASARVELVFVSRIGAVATRARVGKSSVRQQSVKRMTMKYRERPKVLP